MMFPYLIFISLAALAMGILNSLRAFAAPAFSPVFFNLFIIGCALFLVPTVAGAHPRCRSWCGRRRSRPVCDAVAGAQVARHVIRIQIQSWPSRCAEDRQVDDSVAAWSVRDTNKHHGKHDSGSFFAGGPTYLFYGMRLIQFPLGIFGVALATAILPTLSAQAARGALDELRTTLGFGLRMILFIMLPAMVGLILLRTPIVHLFFEHGTFTAHDTAETAFAVLCYAVGLWAFSGVRIIVSAFYSMKDTTTPAISATIAVVTNILFSLFLMSHLGAAGLALATALAAMVNGGILVVVFNRRLGGVEWRSVINSAGRVLVGCLPIVVACWWVAGAQIWSHPAEWMAKSAMLAVAMALSVGGYLGVHAVLRSEELDVLWGMVRRKLGRLAK
ncbi:MAG: oligosaccharide flippase family protein [Nitrospira sp.]|nr:oligosaccharide flippase family protein [Nitrospira sp.]